MATVTVSPKFQVVIPQEVREAMDLQPGEKLQSFSSRTGSSSSPFAPKQMRGFLRGIDTTVDRDPDRV